VPSVSDKELKYILVVEDDDAIRAMLEDLLRDHAYLVAVATDGAEALTLMSERLPDLVVLDLMMGPGMSGWEFLQTRGERKVFTDVPVLVLSASGPSGLTEAGELGAPVYLAKPFNIDDLLSEVRRLSEEPVRQCAWCGRVMDAAGVYRLQSGRKLRWATHGICARCGEAERRKLSG
jgi:DNA-binding response OmpR family regulator